MGKSTGGTRVLEKYLNILAPAVCLLKSKRNSKTKSLEEEGLVQRLVELSKAKNLSLVPRQTAIIYIQKTPRPRMLICIEQPGMSKIPTVGHAWV